MGSNLSPFLAEVFMHSLEQIISEHSLFRKHIKTWFRYVDDIFTVFTGTRKELDSFLQYLNTIHNCIKFTCEIEQNNCLPFLDLLITINENKFEFEIYRKPSATDNIIPFSSNHPHTQKLAAFNSLFHRLFTIPLNKSCFDKEYNTIFQIAKNNGYPLQTITRIYQRHLNKFLNRQLYNGQEEKSMYRSIKFYGSVSSSVAKSLEKGDNNNTKICFRTTNNLSKHLVNTKDKLPILQRSGVYRLTCSQPQCNVCYVGQSGRKIETRVNEHVRLIQKNKMIPLANTSSPFANHILESGHKFDSGPDTKVLHVCQKGLQLDLLEIFEINRAIKSPDYTCVNEQTKFDSFNFFNTLN